MHTGLGAAKEREQKGNLCAVTHVKMTSACVEGEAVGLVCAGLFGLPSSLFDHTGDGSGECTPLPALGCARPP